MFQAPGLHVDTRRCSKTSSADAALTAAGAEFEPLLREYLEERIECYRLAHATDTALKAELGVKELDYAIHDSWYPRKQQIAKKIGFDASRRHANRLSSRLEAMAKKIRRHKPSGLEGLRTFALLSIYETAPICWDQRELLTSDEVAHEVLLKAMLAATGLSDVVSSFLSKLTKQAGD